jgi:hypothetical protein
MYANGKSGSTGRNEEGELRVWLLRLEHSGNGAKTRRRVAQYLKRKAVHETGQVLQAEHERLVRLYVPLIQVHAIKLLQLDTREAGRGCFSTTATVAPLPPHCDEGDDSPLAYLSKVS